MSAPITAAMVNDLRKRTDMPMMECKAALVEVGGDMEKAIDLIRIKMKGVGVKRAGNETAEGRVSTYIDSAAKVAAVVEVRCESAPVAKSDHYVALGKEIARAVADKNPANVEALMAAATASGKTVADRFTETIGLLRENMKIHRFERLSGGSFGEYVHHDGSLGVIVQADGAGDAAALKDLSMHVAAVQPTPISVQRDGVPASVIAKEKEIATAKALMSGFVN